MSKTLDQLLDEFAKAVKSEPAELYDINKKLAKLEIGLNIMKLFSKALEGGSFSEVGENFRKALNKESGLSDE